jgi:hypothetical protein
LNERCGFKNSPTTWETVDELLSLLERIDALYSFRHLLLSLGNTLRSLDLAQKILFDYRLLAKEASNARQTPPISCRVRIYNLTSCCGISV